MSLRFQKAFFRIENRGGTRKLTGKLFRIPVVTYPSIVFWLQFKKIKTRYVFLEQIKS